MKARWVWIGLTCGLCSCASSWTEETIQQTLGTCIELTAPLEGDSLAKVICSCYVTKLVERYPANNQIPEDIQPIINECVDQHPRAKDSAQR